MDLWCFRIELMYWIQIFNLSSFSSCWLPRMIWLKLSIINNFILNFRFNRGNRTVNYIFCRCTSLFFYLILFFKQIFLFHYYLFVILPTNVAQFGRSINDWKSFYMLFYWLFINNSVSVLYFILNYLRNMIDGSMI